MLIDQFEHIALTDRVHAQLEAMILTGELVPGQRIHQEQISGRLGVSRTVLLAVLQRLVGELLVVNLPRRGFFVRSITLPELVESFESRIGIECLAARIAAGKITDADIVHLRSIFEPYRDNPENADRQAYAFADRKFHKEIFRLCSNPVLEKLDIVVNILVLSFQYLHRSPATTLDEHLAIIDALERRDGPLAYKRTEAHLRQAIVILEKSVNVQTA